MAIDEDHTLPQQMPVTKLIQELQNIKDLRKTMDDLKSLNVQDDEDEEEYGSLFQLRTFFAIDYDIKTKLISFVKTNTKCEVCEIMDEKYDDSQATYAKIESSQQDSSYVVTLICEQCQHNCPSHPSTLFSKAEVEQMFKMFKDEKNGYFGNLKYKRLIVKLIGLQCKRTFLTSAEEKQIKEKLELNSKLSQQLDSEKDSFDSFVELLDTRRACFLADMEVREFRAREHKKVEDIVQEAKLLLDSDFTLMRNMLCYLKNENNGHKHNPIEIINKITTSHRFKELMNNNFTYLDYVKSNNKYWSLKLE